jgi:hypothetical protein
MGTPHGVISMAQKLLWVQQICGRYEGEWRCNMSSCVHVVDAGLATPSSWLCGIDAPARHHAGIWSPSKPCARPSSCIHVKLCDTTFYPDCRTLLPHDKQPQNTSPPVVALVAHSEARTPPWAPQKSRSPPRRGRRRVTARQEGCISGWYAGEAPGLSPCT